MKIVLISGKKRSGKDFAARKFKQILENKNKRVLILSFAEPIKRMVCSMFDISFAELEKYKNNPEKYPCNSPKPTDFRVLLQRFGTEAAKTEFGNDVWVQLLKKRIERETSANYVIIPDFRFEIEHISPITVNVFNDEMTNENDSHESENALNNFDFKYQVNNTGQRDITTQISQICEHVETSS